jgi:hypothetical protein
MRLGAFLFRPSVQIPAMQPLLAISIATGVFIILTILSLGFVGWLLLRTVTRSAQTAITTTAQAPGELVDGLLRAVKSFFNGTPEVTINTKVIHAQNTDILEVATASQNIYVTKRVEDQWLFSKKTLTYSAIFQVKAGFDLTQPFKIQVTDSPLRARVVIGCPKVLSVEQLDLDMKESAGWWNRISEADRTQLLNSLKDQVHCHGEVAVLLGNARRHFEARLTQAAAEKAAAIDFEYLALAAA